MEISKYVTYPFKLPREMYTQVKTIARAQDRSVAYMLRVMIRDQVSAYQAAPAQLTPTSQPADHDNDQTTPVGTGASNALPCSAILVEEDEP